MIILFIYFVIGVLFILVGIPIIQAITDLCLYIIDIFSSLCIKIIYDIKAKTKNPEEGNEVSFPIGFQIPESEEEEAFEE